MLSTTLGEAIASGVQESRTAFVIVGSTNEGARNTRMVDDATLEAWFLREVFPLEAALTRFIRRKWPAEEDVLDLRQEIYARVYAAARERLPIQPKPFLFTTARNHMINCARRARIISMDQIADLEASIIDVDAVMPDRNVIAREELRRLQAGLDLLPRRCREVMVLRRVEGLSTREAATRLGVSVNNVEQQMVHGEAPPLVPRSL